MRESPLIHLIAGPTASGKSEMARELAKHTGGLIVNADSMQVYTDLRLLTARPTPEEEAQHPHRLYGHVDGADSYTVARWLADLAPLLREGRPLLLTGGTGLYFRAALEGLAETPAIPQTIKEKWQQIEPDLLHEALRQRDPEMAEKLHRSDTPRLLRALEVIEATGVSLRIWQQRAHVPLLKGAKIISHLHLPDRDELYRRIDRRFISMIEGGALEEVRTLMDRNLPPDRGVMKAHGVPHLIAHLEGRLSLEEAITLSQRDTRRYAKRQLTWWRHHPLP